MQILIKENQVKEIVKNLSTEIKDYFNGEEFTLIPIMNGAAYLSVDLSRELGGMGCDHHYTSVFYRSYEGQEQKSGKMYPEKLSISTKNVLLFDELYDTGDTISKVANEILLQYPESNIKTAVVFLKNKKNVSTCPDFYGIKTHDIWLVGCGLDDNGLKRYLKDVYAIPKPIELSHLKSEHDDFFTNKEYRDSFYYLKDNDMFYIGF